MSTELPTLPPPPSFWERWKLGLRIILTVGIGLLVSWISVSILTGLILMLLGLVMPENSTAADWITGIVVGSSFLIGLPRLMYNWCSFWRLPRVDPLIDLGLLRSNRRVPPQS